MTHLTPPRLRRRRSDLRARLDGARAARDARIRHDLLARLDLPRSRSGPSGPLLVLGWGSIQAQDPVGAAIEIGTAPLVVAARAGVRVLAPPLLARFVIDAYTTQLAQRYPDGSSADIVIEPGEQPSSGARRPGAEVWIGPDGTALARSPTEARGRWVPLELRL